jgi:hypothetical protein
MKSVVDPKTWIAQWIAHEAAGEYRHPLIYLAHPVAPRTGETLAWCTHCKAEATYTLSEPLDLRRVCDHDDPVRHTEDPAAIVAYNLRRAIRWWKWYANTLTEAVFLMPWYVNVTANGEADPAKIERGLRDDCATVMRCDALIHNGPRISSGMAREARAAYEVGNAVFQVKGIHGEPPHISAFDVPWIEVHE